MASEAQKKRTDTESEQAIGKSSWTRGEGGVRREGERESEEEEECGLERKEGTAKEGNGRWEMTYFFEGGKLTPNVCV